MSEPVFLSLANPRGFCAGVDRAISIVEQALALFPPPIFVRHEVVHNRHVVADLGARGARFVESLDQVPDGSVLIFSAHGVPRSVRMEAESRGMRLFDATCPLVTKVHLEVARHSRAGREVVLIGHAGHPEVEGTMGQYDPQEAGGAIYLVETIEDVATLSLLNPQQVSYATQTTLSMDDASAIIKALRERFPAISGPNRDDICYATQNRQDAVKQLADDCDLVLVVGSPNSSNSNRLREIAERSPVTARLIDDASDLKREWLAGCHRVGVTAGASAPEHLVQGVIEQLRAWGLAEPVELAGEREERHFPLPKELLNAVRGESDLAGSRRGSE